MPRPRRRIWVGTSGWSYRHWIGLFYPKGLAATRWFDYYTSRFPTVELNASFYRQPTEAAWDDWRERAPAGFRFAVKASRYITHVKRLYQCRQEVGRFAAGAKRLGEHLGTFLFQLPPSFHPTAENVRRLEAFLPLLRDQPPCAFEFRHASWLVDETYATLRRHGAALCVFDMPGLECPMVVTAPAAYLRFHGTGQRYAGNYPDSLLEEWAGRIRALPGDVEEIWIYFNNDARGFAVKNAAKLADLLEAERARGRFPTQPDAFEPDLERPARKRPKVRAVARKRKKSSAKG